MPTVSIQITRFVDEHFPGIVEFALKDALGNTHLFIEKAPIVSSENLYSASIYPCFGKIDCEIENEWRDEKGCLLFRINTDLPWHVESTTGESVFIVHATQIERT